MDELRRDNLNRCKNVAIRANDLSNRREGLNWGRDRRRHGDRKGRLSDALLFHRASRRASRSLVGAGQTQVEPSIGEAAEAGLRLITARESYETASILADVVDAEDVAIRMAHIVDVTLSDAGGESTEMDLFLLTILAIGETRDKSDARIERICAVEGLNEVLSAFHASKMNEPVLGCTLSFE